MVYSKPEMMVTVFDLNQAVAACAPSIQYNQVTVSCVVTEDHKVFYDGCEYDYDDMAIVKNFYTRSGGNSTAEANDYLVWAMEGYTVTSGTVVDASERTDFAGSSAEKASTSSGPSLVDAIMDVFFGQNGNYEYGYHAGVITPNVKSVVNSSL